MPAHAAARTLEGQQQRNKQALPPPADDAQAPCQPPPALAAPPPAPQQQQPPLCAPALDATDAHDATFWLGDFNYRISGNARAVTYIIRARLHEVLHANDQLRAQQRKGRVFQVGCCNLKVQPAHV